MMNPIIEERKRRGRPYVPRNKFGLWLHNNMVEHGMRRSDVAEKLRVTGPYVSNHACGNRKPTFMNVVAYCWLFGNIDDPEEIWKLVDEKI